MYSKLTGSVVRIVGRPDNDLNSLKLCVNTAKVKKGYICTISKLVWRSTKNGVGVIT